jgi:uncharacterized protein (DUF1697 family)
VTDTAYDATMHTWLVLLRGINVGGNNVIAMADLRHSFADMGFHEPATYIQSGNVLVGARSKPTLDDVRRIEAELSKRFGYAARIVVRDRAQMRRLVREIPAEWDPGNTSTRYYVLFPVAGVRPRDIVREVTPKPEVEAVAAGAYAVYWSAPFATLTRSTMAKLATSPVYKQVTVRNLNTTLKLCSLMEARG